MSDNVPHFSEDPMAALVWAWRQGYEIGHSEALEGCVCPRPNRSQDRVVVCLDDRRRSR